MNDRIRSACRQPCALSEDDTAALVALMTNDARQGRKRAKSRQNAGGLYEAERTRKMEDQCRRRDQKKLVKVWT